MKTLLGLACWEMKVFTSEIRLRRLCIRNGLFSGECVERVDCKTIINGIAVYIVSIGRISLVPVEYLNVAGAV